MDHLNERTVVKQKKKPSNSDTFPWQSLVIQ